MPNRQPLCGTGRDALQQGIAHHADDEVMYQPRLVESHLMLGGMDIDIHLVWVQLQIEDKGGRTLQPQGFQITLADRVVDQLIPHDPTIDVAVLDLRGRLGRRRGRQQPARERQSQMLAANG